MTRQVRRLPGLICRSPSQVLVDHGRSIFHKVAQVGDRENLLQRGRPGAIGTERCHEEVLLDFVGPAPIGIRDSATEDCEKAIGRGDGGSLIPRMRIFWETEAGQVLRLGQVLVHLGRFAGCLAAVDRRGHECRSNVVIELPQHRSQLAR